MDIDKFVHDQLSLWPQVAAKYRALKGVHTRTMPYGGMLITLQSNPGRMPIMDHGCPLCEENYLPHQHTLPIEGRKGRKYNILVNRAPIFPNHLVITRNIHAPQTIWHRYPDMLDLAASLDNYLVFYNSPHCGTSVPQHAHFQACPKGYMPLERVAERLLRGLAAGSEVPEELEFIASVREARLYHYKRFHRGIFFLRAQTDKSMSKLFYRLMDCLMLEAEGEEPRFNALCYCSEGEYRAVVIVRSAHKHPFLSPGIPDLAGFIVLPEEQWFQEMGPDQVQQLYDICCISEAEEKQLLWRLVRTQPLVEVSILQADSIGFEIISDGAGPQRVACREGRIDYNGALYDELVFEAVTISTLFAEPSFILETADGPRSYAGTLKFRMKDGGGVEAVNILGAEDYLLSVISAQPLEGRASRVRELRKELFAHPQKGLDVPYPGLGPAADRATRQLIDESWGQLE